MGRVKYREGQRTKLFTKLRLRKGYDQRTFAFVRLSDGLTVSQPEVRQIERYGFDGAVSRIKVEAALPVFAGILGYEGDPRDLLEEVRF